MMTYGDAADAEKDDYWESVISDPFIRSCVRGIQRWLLSLDRPEIYLWRTKSHYNVRIEGSRKKTMWWYFHGSKTGNGWFIHVELPDATSGEIMALRANLSNQRDQPYNKKSRSDATFTFNVYHQADLDLVKQIFVSRFNVLVNNTGRPERRIE